MKGQSTKKIIAATNNSDKLIELRNVFPQCEILSLEDAGITHEVVEDGDTFAANACKKAEEIYQIANCPVIADDSGLTIDSLNGFPGVLTHRWLGENATDEDRNSELVRMTRGGTARFVCVLVYYDGQKMTSCRSELVGKIASSPRGKNGFGFDPIFELSDGRTLAQLSPEEKNACSARRQAATELAEKLR